MGLLAIIWMGIFAGLIAGSIIGIIYMSKSLLKMGWFHKLLSKASKGKARTEKLMAGMVVALVMLALGYFIGFINALIAILHLTVFWIIKDILLWLVKRLTKKEITRDGWRSNLCRDFPLHKILRILPRSFQELHMP